MLTGYVAFPVVPQLLDLALSVFAFCAISELRAGDGTFAATGQLCSEERVRL